MRRPAWCAVALLGLVFAGSLSAMLRRPEPVVPAPPAPPPAMAEVAGAEEYARMLAHVLRFEWKQAEGVARRYVDLVDGRDRTEYVRGLLYRMRTQRVSSLNDLAMGSVDCARCAGVSLHNLMLFFRHQDTPGWRKLGMPTRLVYERGLRIAPADIMLNICRAGLLVDLGQVQEADRLFREPHTDLTRLTTNDLINMAYYWAARADRAKLAWWLERAMERDAAHTREWAAESDDLDAYRGDPVVDAVLSGVEVSTH